MPPAEAESAQIPISQKPIYEHFGSDATLVHSPYIQGSILLLLYEFVRSNSFFLDFVFYDHSAQCSSSGKPLWSYLSSL